MNVPFLEIDELRKQYGTTTALAGVTFRVQRGEVFGLLGPNGAGKTTLLSILSGLVRASSGSVRFRGVDALPLAPDARREIGIVPQELAIYADLSARENLTFFGRLYGINGSLLPKRVDEVLEAVGLADRASDPVSTFSGGMKRRLNLGAALVHKPNLLFLDEPTIGVDPQSRNHIFDEIRRVNKSGATIVYTSHYMEEVETLCQRVGIMDCGRLIACDHVATLLRQLAGVIRVRVPAVSEQLQSRLDNLPDVSWTPTDATTIELECRDVKATLLRVLAILSDLNLEILKLETQEPNLENLFLHLTGRALRD